MRWQALFADLESQAQALERSERAVEVAERARIEIGALDLVGRLGAAVGSTARLRCVGGMTVSGTVAGLAPEWVLVDEAGGRETLVTTRSLTAVTGLGRGAQPPGALGLVESRLSVRHVLRGIAADRSAVSLFDVDGARSTGTIDRVGADFVEVARHAAAEPRRRHDVRDVALVPLAAIVAVRRDR